MCDHTPTIEEVKESLDIANKENCIVHLKWYIPYNGWNEYYIRKDDDIDEIMKRFSNIIYGL